MDFVLKIIESVGLLFCSRKHLMISNNLIQVDVLEMSLQSIRKQTVVYDLIMAYQELNF